MQFNFFFFHRNREDYVPCSEIKEISFAVKEKITSCIGCIVEKKNVAMKK